MCRSIKTLRRPEGLATEEEVGAAALQFVRKVSGYRAPSRANKEAFDAAVVQITAASSTLLSRLGGPSSRVLKNPFDDPPGPLPGQEGGRN